MSIRAFAAIGFLATATLSPSQDMPKTSIADVRTQPKTPKTHWAWITSLIVLDAVQAGDVLSSRGGVDSNPLVGNRNGTFNTERAVTLKAAVYGSITAAQLLIHHYNHHNSDGMMTATNSVVSGFYGWVIVHNERIKNQTAH